ncbi:MAG: hypothetical protein JWL61_4165 [Gemmatimonadetes bacterium]|nr:hypothetical protein [Gemmatimonadota bacterium]
MITFRGCLAALVLIAASACARSAPSAEAVPRGNPNVISKAELDSPVIASMDALKAIRYLRPSFFRTSGQQSFSNGSAGQVQFSMDFGPLRPLSELASLRTDLLYEVRYLDPSDAQNRFGVNANGGAAIVLLSNKQP